MRLQSSRSRVMAMNSRLKGAAKRMRARRAKRIEDELFRFPYNRRAMESNREEQAAYVLREAAELYAEAAKDWAYLDEQRVAEEAWDVIQSVEGVLREIDPEIALLAKARVKMKCMKRGDYR